MALYKNKYRIESTRLQKWDYGWNGKYFITIVTKNRIHYFGKIDENKTMHLSESGKIAEKYWYEIPKHFPFAVLDEFIVMPNHIHGIVFIDKKRDDMKLSDDDRAERSRDKACLVSRQQLTSTKSLKEHLTPGQKRFRNPGKNNISSIFGSYKSVVSNNAHKINPEFDWQSRFHDHIIRDDAELDRIRYYIRNNPKKWNDDKFHK
ncbi:MAG: transposase [Chlorobi bacterium]|nr:transposase [Chlorobiota bacterium]